MNKKVIGEYSSFYAASNVARELMEYGFASDQIDIIARSRNEQYRFQFADENGSLLETSGLFNECGAGVRIGAAIGATAGFLSAILAGFAAVSVPVLLPGLALVAAGTGIGALSGSVVGRAVGTLIGFRIPEAETEQYIENVRQGGILVAVEAETYNLNLVRDVMWRYRPENIDEQAIAVSGS